ncbi:DUF3025 domain-containing protein [Herbaspirillum sp. GCM10030257]|uniref:DUF3025 domain-containing protein n=1 Tax=Herbaspirillum sp. GCM10030257 TaxID=3273393 RepID=UPI003608EAC2
MFDTIDWTKPWLAPLRLVADSVLHAADWLGALNDATNTLGLHNHRGMPIRFVPQAELPPGTAYEAFISATGRVPTRENLHDFFNALVWLSFPKTKIQLNALQSAALEASRQSNLTNQSRRGPVRDAATIFDENAALLVSRDVALVESLRTHAWQHAWLAHRDDFIRDCEVWLFGHALMEKLVKPFKSITAHAWVLIVDDAYFEMHGEAKRRWLDAAVAQSLAGGLKTADFSPLPVLGVPGWWDRQDEAFYGDTTVFRPKRQNDRSN